MDSQVSDIMNQTPITLSCYAHMADARELMATHNIRHLPIIDNARHLVGLLSQRDILAAAQPHHLGDDLILTEQDNLEVSTIMTKEILSISPDMSVKRAAEMLSKHHIGCLPVVEDQQLVGIVTGSDFINVAINLLQLLDEESVMD